MSKQLRRRSRLTVAVVAVLVVTGIFIVADLLNNMVDLQAAIPVQSVTVNSSLAQEDQETAASARQNLAVLLGGSPSPQPLDTQAAASATAQTNQTTADAELQAAQTSGTGPETSGNYPSQPVQTNQELELQGVMIGNGASIAVLEYQGQSYTAAPGDQVGGYEIEQVQADSVTVSKAGQRSKVAIGGNSQAAGSPAIGSYPPVLPDPESVPLPPAPVPVDVSEPAAPNPVYLDDGANYERKSPSGGLSRQALNSFAQSGAKLVGDIYATTVADDGLGVQIRFRNPQNALAQLGVKDKDIVLSINGKMIRSQEELYNSCLALKDAPHVKIELMRRGQVTNINYQVPD